MNSSSYFHSRRKWNVIYLKGGGDVEYLKKHENYQNIIIIIFTSLFPSHFHQLLIFIHVLFTIA